jgi:hypothetical protein
MKKENDKNRNPAYEKDNQDKELALFIHSDRPNHDEAEDPGSRAKFQVLG